MRLATLSTPTGPLAVVIDGLDAIPIRGHDDVGKVLRAGAAGLEAAHDARATRVGARPYDPTRLLRPVLAPGAVVCVGLNYRTHILEMGREIPRDPTLFTKLPRALTDPFADVVLPRHSDKLDYEAELAIVIGAAGRDVPRERAWEHVAGLTILNDVTARDFQRRTLQWFAGKSFHASTPVGPWIVTPDELGPDTLGERELWLTVNGEERQRAPLDDLVFGVEALVSDLSRIVELAPGDLIATGTPGGVGEPQGRFLADGHVVEVGIDGIGSLRNTFRAAP